MSKNDKVRAEERWQQHGVENRARWPMGRGSLGVVLVTLFAASATLVGCGPDELAYCNDLREMSSTSVVYTVEGTPYYAGQALVEGSCGAGTFCHSAGISDANRLGVPAGLDFNVTPSETPEGAQRLATGVSTIRDWREEMWEAVDDGTMPPEGDKADVTVIEVERRYRFVDPGQDFFAGRPLPPLESAEGREILRTWLACGAPVVERTTPHPAGQQPVGDVMEARDFGTLEATWSSIYARVIESQCVSCHQSGGPGVTDGALDLSTADGAHAAIVSQPAMGSACGAGGMTLVDPNNPDGSLFLLKLQTNATFCGDIMPPAPASPLPGSVVDVITQWIDNGAPND